MKLAAFKEDFLKIAQPHYTVGTINLFILAFNKFRSVVGNIALTTINRRMIDEYKSKRLKQVSASTVNIELRSLRSAFNKALEWELVDQNPFRGIHLIRTIERPKKFFGQDEFGKLVNAIQEEWLKDVVLFAILTGLRRGEILSLTWQQVNIERKWLYIQSTEHFQTKQGKFRTIPISDTAFQLLMKRREIVRDGLVFRMPDGSPVSGYWASHKLKQYIRRLGIDDNLHFHSLRHSFASWLASVKIIPLYQSCIEKLLPRQLEISTRKHNNQPPRALNFIFHFALYWGIFEGLTEMTALTLQNLTTYHLSNRS